MHMIQLFDTGYSMPEALILTVFGYDDAEAHDQMLDIVRNASPTVDVDIYDNVTDELRRLGIDTSKMDWFQFVAACNERPSTPLLVEIAVNHGRVEW